MESATPAFKVLNDRIDALPEHPSQRGSASKRVGHRPEGGPISKPGHSYVVATVARFTGASPVSTTAKGALPCL